MPASTPLYGLPYPVDADTARSAMRDTPRAAVEAIESTLAGWSGVPAPLAAVVLSNAGLSNSFTTTGSNTAYRKIGSGVDLGMQLARASGWAADVTLFTLPAGYRPPRDRFFLASNVGTAYLCKIETSGRVSCVQAGSGGLIGSIFFYI